MIALGWSLYIEIISTKLRHGIPMSGDTARRSACATRVVKLNSPAMERAGKSLAKMKLADAVSPEELAFAAWKGSVGKRLAKYAWPKALVRGSLIIETEDAIWQQQLFHLRFHILPRLTAVLGEGIVRELEFRVATPRRPPQQEVELRSAVSADEADGIPDTVFRILYKKAREKAGA